MITSTSNKQVKFIQQLQAKARARHQEHLFVAEGPRMVAETPSELLQDLYVAESFVDRWEGSYTEVVSDAVMRAMSDTQTPQGVLAVVKQPAYTLEELYKRPNPHLIFLENLQDPGNLGTILRTGEGAGISAAILHPDTVDLFNPKTVRSTMGSLYRVPFFVARDEAEWHHSIQLAKEEGIKLYAAHLGGSKFYDEFDYTSACGFLIGNEGNGLTAETTAMADELLLIPMAGRVESLNAAMAAGILMYEASRQRRI